MDTEKEKYHMHAENCLDGMSDSEFMELAAKAGYEQLDTIFSVNPDLIFREVAGEAVLVPTGQTALDFNGLAMMNPTGAWIWKRVGEGCMLKDLLLDFSREFDLSMEHTLADFHDFMKIMLDRKLILKTESR